MIGFISDIHGNYPALKAVLSELDKIGCTQIYSLGDVSGYYCMVNECIQELKERGIENILGNHDYYIVNNQKCPRSYTVNLCLDYQRTILTEDNLNWLKKSKSEIKLKDIWMVHGGWNDPLDEYINDFTFLDVEQETKKYLSGHTHVQMRREGKYGIYVNPGSVGQPRDNNPLAAYAVLDKDIELHRVEYDIDEIAFAMKKAGFDERVSSCLYHGVKIGADGK